MEQKVTFRWKDFERMSCLEKNISIRCRAAQPPQYQWTLVKVTNLTLLWQIIYSHRVRIVLAKRARRGGR